MFTVMAPGSASRLKRRALRQERETGPMIQVSMWDTAAVGTEEQWSTSKRRRRTVQGAIL